RPYLWNFLPFTVSRCERITVVPFLCVGPEAVESRGRARRLSSASVIAYRLRRKHQRRTYASWRCRSWGDGRCGCSAPHGSRARGDRLESLAREDQTARRGGRESGSNADRSCKRSRGGDHDAHRRGRDRCRVQWAERPARGDVKGKLFIEMSTVSPKVP